MSAATKGLSYVAADRSVPIRPTTVGGILIEAAAAHPDRPALIEGIADGAARRRWTFAELLESATAAALALRARFEPGERVALWAPSLPEWVILEFGAALAGLILVAVNPVFRAPELRYVLGQSRASGLLHVPEWRGESMSSRIDEIRGDLPALRTVIDIEDWPDFLGTAAAAEDLPSVDTGDIAQIQYTSGTTGNPKGAALNHRSITNNARLMGMRMGLGVDDIWVNTMPMFHTGGCVVPTLGTVQVGAAHLLAPTFDPRLILELIEQEGVTTGLFVPTMLIALLEEPTVGQRRLGTLRTVASGASVVPPELVRRVGEVLGAPVQIMYGQTEASPVITFGYLDDSPEDVAETIGRPLPETEVAIVDPGSGETLAVGEIGEICTRGYLLMDGYFDQPDATGQAIDPQGWLHTGDLGCMDDRGYFRITGRLKDMIIRGGENISPREIEDVLFTHPDVLEVAVFGLPDERWGEIVAAAVRTSPGRNVDPKELVRFCRSSLSPHKAPRRWVFLEEFPLTPSGKIRKFVLRERVVAGELVALEA
jgi:fatty-acyl-CoA synthase